MPVEEGHVRPGRVYATLTYDFVQVVAVEASTVVYRIRATNRIRRALATMKTMDLTAFALFVRAEINGQFFPDFTQLDDYTFDRPPGQV